MALENILYSTHCPRCIVLKQKLDALHIPYAECNDIDEMIAENISQVPVLSVDGNKMDYVSALQWLSTMEED